MHITTFYSCNHFLSNFFPCSFELYGIKYNCVEQYYQASKAVFFYQDPSAILRASNPKEQKRLGCAIVIFDRQKWQERRLQVMYTALKAKFDQNHALRQRLLGTGLSFLVCASPYDTYWGCGKTAQEICSCRVGDWIGYNHLGQLLMKLRACYRRDSFRH